MGSKRFKFEVVKGETEHITYGGKRLRRPTVLIKVGGLSMSKKAFLLGSALVLCQILDGLLTYVGLRFLGVHMEGNVFLRELMHAYGLAPALFAVKTLSALLAVMLALHAHKRRWIRPIIATLVIAYIVLAVAPWTVIIMRAGPNPVAAAEVKPVS